MWGCYRKQTWSDWFQFSRWFLSRKNKTPLLNSTPVWSHLFPAAAEQILNQRVQTNQDKSTNWQEQKAVLMKTPPCPFLRPNNKLRPFTSVTSALTFQVHSKRSRFIKWTNKKNPLNSKSPTSTTTKTCF